MVLLGGHGTAVVTNEVRCWERVEYLPGAAMDARHASLTAHPMG